MFLPNDQLLLAYIHGDYNSKKFCGGIVLKYMINDNYKIVQIAPIFDKHFFKNQPITIDNIESKCKNNNWNVEFTPIRTPA